MIAGLPLRLSNILSVFGIKGKLGQITEGPMLILAQYQLAPGTLFSSVKKLERDIGRELGISGLRVVEVPDSTMICFEIPSPNRQSVAFSPLIYSADFVKAVSPLPICLGVDMAGNPVMKDLSKMPHLLVAGTTGSGKSVGLNSFIISLIHKKSPQELKFVLIDPKRIEFSIYNNQQYMLRPVITDMNIASICLSQLVEEMNSRYDLFEQQTARNIGEYNAKASKKIPYIVCVIDEFADLIMFDKSVEKQVQLLAQKSRAAGIHLIIATQRPSVDVITGSLKANLPTRLSYKVASQADSMTILNTTGAENLLGKGDSLFLEENGTLTRVLGAFITDEDIENALAPYRCQMEKAASAYQLEQNAYVEQKKERAVASEQSHSAKKESTVSIFFSAMFSAIIKMLKSLTIRDWKKIFALLMFFFEAKNNSPTTRKKRQQTNKKMKILY